MYSTSKYSTSKYSTSKYSTSKYSTPLLQHLISSSLEQGIFPEKLKFAKVIPLYKGGSKSELSNYRPISLLSCFSKIYEKAMHARLAHFLAANDILYPSQYGFRGGHSCEHALLEAQSVLLNSLNKQQISALLLIDFSKAFDMVDHSILLCKLEHYGIRGISMVLHYPRSLGYYPGLKENSPPWRSQGGEFFPVQISKFQGRKG